MGIRRGPNIVQSGLVLSLDAGNVRSYPGSGTTVSDVTGRGNSATLTNGADYNSSNEGVFFCDGSNDYIDLGAGTDKAFAHNATWTVQFYFKPLAFVNTYPGILVKGGASGSGVLLYYGNTGVLYWKHNNAQTAIADTNFGIWHNIALAYAGSGNVTAYVDGVSAGPVGSMVSTNTSDNLLLGKGDEPGNNLIGPFYKYSRTLSASEILQNYNMTKSRFGK